MKVPAERRALHDLLVVEAMKVLMKDPKLNTLVVATKAVKQANAVITQLELEG